MYIKLTKSAIKSKKNVFCPEAKVFLHSACTCVECSDELSKQLRFAMAEGLIEKVNSEKEAQKIIDKELKAVTPRAQNDAAETQIN